MADTPTRFASNASRLPIFDLTHSVLGSFMPFVLRVSVLISLRSTLMRCSLSASDAATAGEELPSAMKPTKFATRFSSLAT